MDSEAMFIVASVFKRSGKKKLSSSDIYLILSMDLGWFPPAEAKKFVLWAEENDLLKKEGELLIPTFDLKTIDTPIDFQPSVKKWRIDKKPLKGKLLKHIEGNSDIKDVDKQIDEIAREKQIFFEVAALFICMKYNIKIDGFLDEVERFILHKEVESNRE